MALITDIVKAYFDRFIPRPRDGFSSANMRNQFISLGSGDLLPFRAMCQLVVEAHNFDLPPSLLAETLERMIERQKQEANNMVPEADLRTNLATLAEKQLRWHFLKERLIEDLKLEASYEEIEKQIKTQYPELDESGVKKLVEQQCKTLEEKGLLIKQWDLDFLKADLTWCGRSGSPTKVHRVQSVVLAAKESKDVEPDKKGISDMIHELFEEKTIA